MALLQTNIGTMQFLANYVQHRKYCIMSDTVLQRECTLNRNYLGLIFSWQTCHVLTNLMQRNSGAKINMMICSNLKSKCSLCLLCGAHFICFNTNHTLWNHPAAFVPVCLHTAIKKCGGSI